jgi:LmbE family N-acetylglucosaminyl deacetylase
MNAFSFRKLTTVLCLGAHSDDIEIGCGGTILHLLKENKDLNVVWVVFSGQGDRKREAKQSALSLLGGARSSRVLLKNFEDTLFPTQTRPIKQVFRQLREKAQPDLIFTHFLHDRHQDHRLLAELTWNAFRNHPILEYEIPKFEGDLQQPNLFVPLDQATCERKVRHVCKHFQSQGNKHWFSEDLFLGLMRLRGIECASETKFAEAFHCRKMVFR